MTAQQRLDGPEQLNVFMTCVILLSACTLGISSALAAMTLVLAALLVFLALFSKMRPTRPTFYVLCFLTINLVSAVIFGGINAIYTDTIIAWIGNEGRVFLYYWPMILALELAPRHLWAFSRVFHRVMAATAPLALIIVMMRWTVHIEAFSTHHAAGAFCAMLCIYHYFYYSTKKGLWNLVWLILSGVALLGTNSRTSLLTVLLALLFVTLISGRAAQIARLAAIAMAAAIIMPVLFQAQFARLMDAANVETLDAVSNNYIFAFSGTENLEVSSAWEVSKKIEMSGNANLAIRGILWGRAAREGSQSPIFGIGFGRFNDLNRIFSGVPYLVYPVVDADINSPSDLTAHNSLLHIFAETGALGLFTILWMIRALWQGYRDMPRPALPENEMWSRIGKASIFCLLFMSLTQHALGAPIYGMTLMMMCGVAYRLARSDWRQMV